MNGQQTRQALLARLKAAGFAPLICLESAGFDNDRYGQYEGIVAAGSKHAIYIDTAEQPDLERLRDFTDFVARPEWKFCQFSYDLKNTLSRPPRKSGRLRSDNPDELGFPLMHCFIPEVCFLFRRDRSDGSPIISCIGDNAEAFLDELVDKQQASRPTELNGNLPLNFLTSKTDYLETVEKIRQHIREGDVYEINYCQMLYSDGEVEPLGLFENLMQVSPAPFSAYYEDQQRALVSASPERFLRREGSKIISQPIKGTAARKADPELDRQSLEALKASEKDRAENVMIVDLVRNDFAAIAKTGSIRVEELFGAYSFPQVHQLISTVSGELRSESDLSDILRASFPMGSMTGAPKIAAMQLIEQVEDFRRGLYSGSIGYIDPEGNFDFNVIIRSALYHKAKKRLWIPVGGAITWDSEPEAEYAECLLKASGLASALGLEIEPVS